MEHGTIIEDMKEFNEFNVRNGFGSYFSHWLQVSASCEEGSCIFFLDLKPLRHVQFVLGQQSSLCCRLSG